MRLYKKTRRNRCDRDPSIAERRWWSMSKQTRWVPTTFTSNDKRSVRHKSLVGMTLGICLLFYFLLSLECVRTLRATQYSNVSVRGDALRPSLYMWRYSRLLNTLKSVKTRKSSRPQPLEQAHHSTRGTTNSYQEGWMGEPCTNRWSLETRPNTPHHTLSHSETSLLAVDEPDMTMTSPPFLRRPRQLRGAAETRGSVSASPYLCPVPAPSSLTIRGIQRGFRQRLAPTTLELSSRISRIVDDNGCGQACHTS